MINLTEDALKLTQWLNSFFLLLENEIKNWDVIYWEI